MLLKFSGPDKRAPAYSALGFVLAPHGEGTTEAQILKLPMKEVIFVKRGNCELVLEVQSPTVTLSDLPLPAEAAKAVIEARASDARVGAYLSWKKEAQSRDSVRKVLVLVLLYHI